MYISIKFLKSDEQSMAQIYALLNSYDAKMKPLFTEEEKKLADPNLNSLQKVFRDNQDTFMITIRDLNAIEALYDSLSSASFDGIVDLSHIDIELETSPVQLSKPASTPSLETK